jgi:nucleotide-binding universal stress UspA family protein
MTSDAFENPGSFSEDLGMFEAAAHPIPAEIPNPELKSMYMACDGSNQDATVRSLAAAVAAQTGARIVEQSGAAGIDELLAAAREKCPDLIVVPVPYGEDYRELQDDSLGSAADRLLHDSTCPVLCIRDVMDDAAVDAALRHIVVPAAVGDESVVRAIGWAFRLLRPAGRLDLLAVADRDLLEEAGHFVAGAHGESPFEPEQVVRAILRDIGGIVSAAQKRGVADDLAVHVETRVGPFVPTVLGDRDDRVRLIVCGTTREHGSAAFHRAVDLLLSARGPVLLV